MLLYWFMRNSKFVIILIVLAAVYGVSFTCLNVLKYRSFFSFEWEDDASENQVVYNIAAHFYPHKTIFISKYFFGHFTLIYFLIALFYKIYPSIYTWYFLMSFSYGFCALIVYLLARDILKDEKIAFIISLSYLFYSPLHYVNLGTLDGNNFSLPLLFLSLYFMHKRRFILYIISAVLSCMCKEDIPIIIFTLGLYQLFKKYPKKWWIGTISFSLSYLLLAVHFEPLYHLAHHLPPSAQKEYFRYINYATFREIIKFFTVYRVQALHLLMGFSKWRSLFLFTYPLLFLPLFSSVFYFAFPLMGEIILHHGVFNDISYYFTPIIPFAIIGTVLVLKRVSQNRIRWILTSLILILCLLSNLYRNFLGFIPSDKVSNSYIFDNHLAGVTNIFDPRIYTMDKEDRIAWKFIKMIPKNASVTASGDLLPALSCRRVLYEFGLNIKGALEAPYADRKKFKYPVYTTDYILIHLQNICNGFGGRYPFLGRDLLMNEINNIIPHNGYRIVKRNSSFILFARSTNGKK